MAGQMIVTVDFVECDQSARRDETTRLPQKRNGIFLGQQDIAANNEIEPSVAARIVERAYRETKIADAVAAHRGRADRGLTPVQSDHEPTFADHARGDQGDVTRTTPDIENLHPLMEPGLPQHPF